MKKLIKYLMYVIAGIVFLISIVFYTSNPISENNKLMVVMSGSMEPALEVNDIIVVQKADYYKVDDIITFATSDTSTVTHRIVDQIDKEYITKGDSNNAIDEATVMYENIIGKKIFRIPFIGAIILAVQSVPCIYTAGAVILIMGVIAFIIAYDILDAHEKRKE